MIKNTEIVNIDSVILPSYLLNEDEFGTLVDEILSNHTLKQESFDVILNNFNKYIVNFMSKDCPEHITIYKNVKTNIYYLLLYKETPTFYSFNNIPDIMRKYIFVNSLN